MPVTPKHTEVRPHTLHRRLPHGHVFRRNNTPNSMQYGFHFELGVYECPLQLSWAHHLKMIYDLSAWNFMLAFEDTTKFLYTFTDIPCYPYENQLAVKRNILSSLKSANNVKIYSHRLLINEVFHLFYWFDCDVLFIYRKNSALQKLPDSLTDDFFMKCFKTQYAPNSCRRRMCVQWNGWTKFNYTFHSHLHHIYIADGNKANARKPRPTKPDRLAQTIIVLVHSFVTVIYKYAWIHEI